MFIAIIMSVIIAILSFSIGVICMATWYITNNKDFLDFVDSIAEIWKIR